MNIKAKEMWFEQDETVSNATRYANGEEGLFFDLQFVSQFISSNSVCIDLCCGTGMMTCKMADIAKKVYAIDIVPKFLNQIPDSEKIIKIISDANTFYVDEEVDLITLFGAIQYNTGKDVMDIYNNCYNSLNKNGILVVSGQWGIAKKVIVDNYSEELKKNYFAEYRTVDEECSILEKIGFDTEVVTILPEKFNRFDNTEFKGIVAKK